MDQSKKSRGSEQLFEMSNEDDDAQSLSRAIGGARASYELKWWWKYGTPAIDRIKGGVHVKPEHIGETLKQFLDLNTREVQVGIEVFPLGIVNPDLFQVNLELRRAGRRG